MKVLWFLLCAISAAAQTTPAAARPAPPTAPSAPAAAKSAPGAPPSIPGKPPSTPAAATPAPVAPQSAPAAAQTLPPTAQAAPAAPPSTPADAIRQQLAAARIQREAVRKQAELAAQYRVSIATTSPVVVADCDPLPQAEITPIVDGAAQRNQIDTALLRGVIEQESAGRPCAVSQKGASGLMQLMPATIEQFAVTDAFDPKQNVDAGARFLKQLLDKYKGDLSLALAAYNAGPSTVDQANGIPEIQETKDYVDSIMKKIKPVQ